jgi:hypothetical protein
MVPVPAPTEPSATAPVLACSIASSACWYVIVRARMSLRVPSFVSPTTALSDRTASLPGCASVQRIVPSAACATASVFVSRIGVSISPSSMICVVPMSLP